MNNTTFIRFCRFGFWFRICGYGFGLWAVTPFERAIHKRCSQNFLFGRLKFRTYKP